MSISIDSSFEAIIENMRTAILSQGTAALAAGEAPFIQSDHTNNTTLNGFDHLMFKAVFSRDGIAKIYADATMNAGRSYKDAQMAKVQNDIISGMERDLRMRYRSRVRQLAHASARLMTHGRQYGSFGSLLQYIRVLMDRGNSQS